MDPEYSSHSQNTSLDEILRLIHPYVEVSSDPSLKYYYDELEQSLRSSMPVLSKALAGAIANVTNATTVDAIFGTVSPPLGVGSIVEIIDTGYTYATYADMFRKLGFRDTTCNDSIPKGELATVWAVSKHESTRTDVYALRSASGKECLIGKDGFRVIECPHRIYGLCTDSTGVSYNEKSRTFHVANTALYTSLLNSGDLADQVRMHNAVTEKSGDFSFAHMGNADDGSAALMFHDAFHGVRMLITK